MRPHLANKTDSDIRYNMKIHLYVFFILQLHTWDFTDVAMQIYDWQENITTHHLCSNKLWDCIVCLLNFDSQMSKLIITYES